MKTSSTALWMSHFAMTLIGALYEWPCHLRVITLIKLIKLRIHKKPSPMTQIIKKKPIIPRYIFNFMEFAMISIAVGGKALVVLVVFILVNFILSKRAMGKR